MRARTVCTLIFLSLLFMPSALVAEEREAQSAGLISLQIMPQNVSLWGLQASQQFVVLGQYADGLTRDLTPKASFSVAEKAKGEIDGSGKFVARNNGDAVLTAQVGGRSAKTIIHIEGANKPQPFTFVRDIGGIL